MKSTIVLILFLPICAFSQSVLKPNNPAPRVGDQIELSVSFEKDDLTELESKENRSDLENELIRKNQIAIGTLRMTQAPVDTGEFVVGPLALAFNGVAYTTSKLTLNVAPALPKNVTDGVWVRNVAYGEFRYLIIEQRIANKWKKQDDGNSITLSTEDVTFADFDRDKFESKGLDIVSSSSSTDNQAVDKTAGFESGTAAYKISIFKYSQNPMFKSFTLDKKFFNNFPKGIQLSEVTIK